MPTYVFSLWSRSTVTYAACDDELCITLIELTIELTTKKKNSIERLLAFCDFSLATIPECLLQCTEYSVQYRVNSQTPVSPPVNDRLLGCLWL